MPARVGYPLILGQTELRLCETHLITSVTENYRAFISRTGLNHE